MCLMSIMVNETDTVVPVLMNITCRKGRHLIKYSMVRKRAMRNREGCSDDHVPWGHLARALAYVASQAGPSRSAL